MGMVERVATAMQGVLTDDAEQAARASGFCRRRSKLGGAAFTQALVFGCLGSPEPTLEEWAQAAAAAAVPVQPQAIDQRFGPAAADCLRRVLAAAVRRAVAAGPVAVALLDRFAEVYVQDSTVVMLPDALAPTWPGCGGGGGTGQRAAVKFQVRLGLRTGQMTGPYPEAGSSSDQRSALQAGDDLPAGSLRIADLGYFDLASFAGLSRRGVYWLSRWQDNTAVFGADGVRLDLARWLPSRTGAVADVPITLGVAERLPARLVAFRVPPAEADKRRRRLYAKAAKKGKVPAATRLALCDWTVFVTNVPAALATPAEVSVLARARWQIELLFKLWKSDGRLDESRSQNPWRVLCEVFAKMIALVIQHWLLVTACWQKADRSLRKAARAVRQVARALAATLRDPATMRWVIASLVEALAAAARINRRRAKPATHQTLEQPTIYAVP